MRKRRIVLACLVAGTGLWAGRAAPSQAKPAAAATVPFVGCASDGQAGPQAAPTGQAKPVVLAAAVARQLAYYKAEYGPGVLAPRGWHCFSTYGSDGANLFVSPRAIDTTNVLSPGWKGITGDGIEISIMDGGTSGRFEVAKVIARVFPAYKQFAQNVIAEGLEPASDFPFGPYAGDKLNYRGQSAVEYETPANAQGLGTVSRLQPNAGPIDGVAIISGKDTDLVLLAARISGAKRNLIPAMVSQVESDAPAAAQ
jgi:hypothetical protein